MAVLKLDLCNRDAAKKTRIHCIGIGGSGVGGVAEILHSLGFIVTGSDLNKNLVTEYLRQQGVVIYQDHAAQHVQGMDFVVITGAVNDNHIEVKEARKLNIPVIHRAQMLSELMRYKYGIAISGSHGKTSTTGLIASIFSANNDSSFVIGGSFGKIATGAKLGQGKYMVVEADESDGSLLKLNPLITVITNIDRDHMDFFGGDYSKLQRCMLDFIHRMPFYGSSFLCLDDPGIAAILPQVERKVITYGLAANADYRLVDFKIHGMQIYIEAARKDKPNLKTIVNAQGTHNGLNALAAIAVASEENIPDNDICDALANYRGVARRFQQHGDINYNGKIIKLIEDYGHHPREIKSIIDTARSLWPRRRIVMAYQPHRYTRTRDLFNEFVIELAQVDLLLLLPVYSAGEVPIINADSKALADAINKSAKCTVEYLEWHEFLSAVYKNLAHDDILLIQGAGNIGSFVKDLMASYA